MAYVIDVDFYSEERSLTEDAFRKSWIAPIQPQETFSGGQLPRLFETPLALRTLLLTDDWADLEVSFHTFVATTGSALTFRNYSTGQEAAERLLGSMIIQNIPTQGVDEVFHSLVETFEFHYRALAQLPPHPEPPKELTGVAQAATTRAPMSLEE